MKLILIIIAFLANSAYAGPDELDLVLTELRDHLHSVRCRYDSLKSEKEYILYAYELKLQKATGADEKIHWLLQRDSLKSVVDAIRTEESIELSRIKYLKGLQIMRILYDKILSLDHHFASVRTFNEINRISNPNHYPEFGKLKEILSKSKRRESVMELGGVLASNTIASVVMALGNIFNSDMNRQQQLKELEKVECIIDFTLRMHNDLNTIYFETAFLQKSNDRVRADIEGLFRDYTKPIDYPSSLEVCRNTDDWESVKSKTDQYIASLKSAPSPQKSRMQINIEFPVERLLQFIIQYNNFIDQGGKFYEKFRIILNSYENEKPCESQLPPEYAKLKADIDLAIEKFNTAYKPVELNGSKMKEILYGINEFE
jgi:hypothetical protein